MSIKFLKYAGNKSKFIDKINFEINKTNKSIYVEPFLGSGSVFLNLEKEFDSYILNDLDRNLIRIFNSFKNSTFEKYKIYESIVFEYFGDIKNNKEQWYLFRNEFNKTHWKKNTIKEGFYLFMLYNSCLNSLSRFGPNGFNQSFGKRYYNINENDFNIIKSKLEKTIIYNLDFFELINKIDLENSILFLDPPYIKRPAGYATINDEFYSKFINFCKFTKSDILYTDVYHDDLDLKYIILREQMQNISPNRKEEYTEKEVMYKNYRNI